MWFSQVRDIGKSKMQFLMFSTSIFLIGHTTMSTGFMLRWADGAAASLPTSFTELCEAIVYSPRSWSQSFSECGFNLKIEWKETSIDWHGGLRGIVGISSAHGHNTTSSLENCGIDLMSIRHNLHEYGENVEIYGEGFQMLSQTSGTLRDQVDIGMFTDQVI
jgi:hypothetical protein